MKNTRKPRPSSIRYWVVSDTLIRLTLGSALKLCLMRPKRRAGIIAAMYTELLKRKEPFAKALFLPTKLSVYYPIKEAPSA